MARKQTSGRLNRFLDLIGLVDSDRDDTAQEAPARTTRACSIPARTARRRFEKQIAEGTRRDAQKMLY